MNKIKTFGSLIICCALNAFASSAQSQDPQITQLLNERRSLAAQHQEYAGVERSIVDLGQFPPALVTRSTADGKATFDFITYKEIRPEREDAIQQRILVSIPQMESVSIENKRIIAIFRTTASEADITEFFRLMGYNSYELKSN